MNYCIENDSIFMTLDKGELINKTFEVYAKTNDIGQGHNSILTGLKPFLANPFSMTNTH